MAPPGGQPVRTISTPLPGMGPSVPVATPLAPVAAPFTLAPVPSPSAQYLPPVHTGAYTFSLGVPKIGVGVLAERIGIATPTMPYVLAAAHRNGYDVVGLVGQSLATRTMPQMRAALLQIMNEDPQLMRRIVDAKIDLPRLHGASFILTVASFLGATQLVKLCGIKDPNVALAIIVGTTHAVEPILSAVANVAMNRFTTSPIRIGGALVNYVGLAEVEGEAQLTVIYKGATQRAVWEALVRRLYPEGVTFAAVSKGVACGVWGLGKAVVTAPFGGGAIGGVSFALQHWVDELAGSLGIEEGWTRGILSAVSLLGPGAVEAYTAAKAGTKTGVVTRLLETPAGRFAAGIGYLYSASFFLSCMEWGMNRIKYGGDDAMAYAGRAQTIGELVYANGLPWLFRKVGLGGMSNAIAAGDVPSLLDFFDRQYVEYGWMDPRQTAAAIREQVDIKNGAVAKQSTDVLLGMLRALYRDLDGRDTPMGLLSGLQNGWLDTVRHPSFLQNYNALADRRMQVQPLVNAGLMDLPEKMAAPELGVLSAVYQQLRALYNLRIYDPRAVGFVSAFAEAFLAWNPKEDALPTGMPIITDPEALLTSIGGVEQILGDRRQLFYSVLANILTKMAAEDLDLNDLRGWAQLAATQPEGTGDLVAPITVAGKDVEAAIALVEWAREHGYLDEHDQIRPTADYYAMLEKTGQKWGVVDPTVRTAWQQWALDKAAEMQMALVTPETARDVIRADVDALKVLNVTYLFDDDPETAHALETVVAHAVQKTKPRTSVGWEAIQSPDPPAGPADATLQKIAVDTFDTAREALALDVEAQIGRPGLMEFTARSDPFALGATYTGLTSSTRPSLADVPELLRKAVAYDPMLAVQFDLDPQTGIPRSVESLQTLLAPTLHDHDAKENRMMDIMSEPGNPAPMSAEYRKIKADALVAGTHNVRKALAPVFATAVAMTGSLAERRAFINAYLRQIDNRAYVAQQIQTLLVLERQLGLTGTEGSASEAFHSDGTIARVTALREWLGEDLVDIAVRENVDVTKAAMQGRAIWEVSANAESALQVLRLQLAARFYVTGDLQAMHSEIASLRGLATMTAHRNELDAMTRTLDAEIAAEKTQPPPPAPLF